MQMSGKVSLTAEVIKAAGGHAGRLKQGGREVVSRRLCWLLVLPGSD